MPHNGVITVIVRGFDWLFFASGAFCVTVFAYWTWASVATFFPLWFDEIPLSCQYYRIWCSVDVAALCRNLGSVELGLLVCPPPAELSAQIPVYLWLSLFWPLPGFKVCTLLPTFNFFLFLPLPAPHSHFFMSLTFLHFHFFLIKSAFAQTLIFKVNHNTVSVCLIMFQHQPPPWSVNFFQQCPQILPTTQLPP